MSSILYISYDGIMEPLGYSQVWNYLKRTSEKRNIYLISFEKEIDLKNKTRILELEKECSENNLVWIRLKYHKFPSSLATSYDIIMGLFVSLSIVKKNAISIVHARSYVPAAIVLLLRYFVKVKFIFDMRGFWADEKADSGVWKKNGILYNLTKRLEKRFLLESDCIVSLTNAAVNEMKSFDYLKNKDKRFEVITTCADLDLFSIKRQITQSSVFTLGYVGNVHLWYAFQETLECFKILQKKIPNSNMLIVNKDQHEFIKKCLYEEGIDDENVELISANHQGVSDAMQRMNAGIFFIKPFYSKLASAPTRLGEFLGCGIPCLGNYRVGDMGDILENNNVGVAIKDFSIDSLEEGVDRIISLANSEGIGARCRSAAENNFSLFEGTESFKKIYTSLENEQ